MTHVLFALKFGRKCKDFDEGLSLSCFLADFLTF